MYTYSSKGVNFAVKNTKIRAEKPVIDVCSICETRKITNHVRRYSFKSFPGSVAAQLVRLFTTTSTGTFDVTQNLGQNHFEMDRRFKIPNSDLLLSNESNQCSQKG